MASLLPSLVDNLAEEIHKIKCKDCDSCFEFKNVNESLIHFIL